MIYLAIDHVDPNTNRPMPNGIPQSQHPLIESMDGTRLDYPRIIYYLRDCGIKPQVVRTIDAPVDAWYPMVLGYFDFSVDYLAAMSDAAYQKLKNKQIKLIFTYHEGDHPGRIRQRIDQLCVDHKIESDLVWLISGNSTADQYHNSIYWPELEFMYWRTVDRSQGSVYHLNPRSHAFTGLCRIDKLWRKVFMSELWKNHLHQRGYFSYTQYLLGSEDDYYGCALQNTYLKDKQSQVDEFIAAGPFFVDQLDTDTHNNYAANMTDLYQDSYFNIVLETMIDIDGSNGQFVTEKTFKPIFNNQFFVAVSSAGHLAHLHELGYKTFANAIDEHYDTVTNNQERFECVLELTKTLCSKSLDELHVLYQKLQAEIQHNHQVFCAGMAHRLQSVVDCINCKL